MMSELEDSGFIASVHVKREAYLLVAEELRKCKQELEEWQNKYKELSHQKSNLADAFLGEFEKERSGWEIERNAWKKENENLKKELTDLKKFFIQQSQGTVEEPVVQKKDEAPPQNSIERQKKDETDTQQVAGGAPPESGGKGQEKESAEKKRGLETPRVSIGVARGKKSETSEEVEVEKAFTALWLQRTYDTKKVSIVQKQVRAWLKKRHLLDWCTLGTYYELTKADLM